MGTSAWIGSLTYRSGLLNRFGRLLGLVILAVSLTSCEKADPNYFPSYGGVYRLESKNFVIGSKEFPFGTFFPKEIEIRQDAFERINGINSSQLYIFALDKKGAIDGLIYRDDFGFEATKKTDLSSMYFFTDEDSVRLSESAGHACKFVFGSDISFTLTPEPTKLAEAYPVCGKSTVEGHRGDNYCERQWSDVELNNIGWQFEEVTLKIHVRVYKDLQFYQLDAYCQKAAQTFTADMTYRRVKEESQGDLRVKDELGANQNLELVSSKPDLLKNMTGLPDDGRDLMEAFEE